MRTRPHHAATRARPAAAANTLAAFRAVPSGAALGAEIQGVDFSLPVPEEVKTAMRGAAEAWAKENDRRIMAGSETGRQRCEKEHNMKITKLSVEDRRAWAFALPNLAQNWAKREDAAKLPGSKILTAWMDFMRTKKQPIVRQWDRE